MLRLPLVIALLLFTSLSASAADEVVLQPVLKNVETLPPEDLNAIMQDVRELRMKYGCHDVNELSQQVRIAFQKHGYFKVLVENPVMPTASKVDEKKIVPVNVVVDPGEKYRLRDIGFTSSAVFSPRELRASFPISDGENLDRGKIAAGLENLRKLYESRGYMFFSAVPGIEIDERQKAISLTIDLDEGALFHAGTLTVRGNESQTGSREKLLNTWKAYEGRVYDSQTLSRFLHDLHVRPGVRPDQIFEVSTDPQTHVVNVYIYLARPIF